MIISSLTNSYAQNAQEESSGSKRNVIIAGSEEGLSDGAYTSTTSQPREPWST